MKVKHFQTENCIMFAKGLKIHQCKMNKNTQNLNSEMDFCQILSQRLSLTLFRIVSTTHYLESKEESKVRLNSQVSLATIGFKLHLTLSRHSKSQPLNPLFQYELALLTFWFLFYLLKIRKVLSKVYKDKNRKYFFILYFKNVYQIIFHSLSSKHFSCPFLYHLLFRLLVNILLVNIY